MNAQKSLDKELKLPTNFNNQSKDYFIKKGDSLRALKKYIAAESKYRIALQIAKKTKDKEYVKRSVYRLQHVMSTYLGKHQESYELNMFLYDFCFQEKDTICLINGNLNLGRLNKLKSEYVKALELYNNALELVERKDGGSLHWNIITAKGILFEEIESNDQSRKEFKKSLKYVTKENYDFEYSMTYINISSTFKNPDSIIYYSEIAAKNCGVDKTKRQCKLAYNNLAWAYVLKDMPIKAKEIIDQHIDLKTLEYSSTDSLYSSLMHTIASIYHELGDYNKAIKYFKIALEVYIKDNDISDIIMTKEDLSESYERVGELKQSLQLLKEIRLHSTELDKVKLKKEIAKIESKKLLQIKEAQISNLEEENFEIGKTINKTKWFSFLLGLFLLITLSILLYRGHKNKVRFHQLNEELSLIRLKSLRSIMNPHFLFNSFSTLQNYILKKDSLKANEYMTEFSGLIRNVLSSSDSIYSSFSKELDILKSYISIEQDRFEEKFDVAYDMDEELIKLDPVIPSMIIQPYIENSIIHGFSHLKAKGLLKLSFKKDKNVVVCTVLDNGIGRDKAERLQKEGNDTIHLSIATRNTNERLRILSKIGNHNANVAIHDLFFESGKAKGTEVVITLPITKTIKNK